MCTRVSVCVSLYVCLIQMFTFLTQLIGARWRVSSCNNVNLLGYKKEICIDQSVFIATLFTLCLAGCVSRPLLYFH